MSDKTFFTRPISGNKTTFSDLNKAVIFLPISFAISR